MGRTKKEKPVGNSDSSSHEQWQREIYENITKVWTEPKSQQQYSISLDSARIFACFDQLNLKTGDKVLDVGCHMSNFLATLGMLYDTRGYGIDISFRCLKNQREKNTELLLKNQYLVANACILPFQNESFDAVLLMDIIEHVEIKNALFIECHRVLKNGGLMIVKVPTERDNFLTYSWFLEKIVPKKMQTHRKDIGHHPDLALTKPEIFSLLENNNFQLLRMKSGWVMFDAIWDALIVSYAMRLWQRIQKWTQEKHTENMVSTDTNLVPQHGKIKKHPFAKLVLFAGNLFSLPDRMLIACGIGSVLYIICRRSEHCNQ